MIPTTDRFGTALSDIVRCANCGHMQLGRMPSDAELETAYADAASDDYVDEEAGQRETARRMLARIERHAPRRGAILDLGCWVGFLLAEARERGWTEQVGIEPSAFASAYARDRLGLDVRTDDLFPRRSRAALRRRRARRRHRAPAASRRGAGPDRVAARAPAASLRSRCPTPAARVAKMLGARWWSVIPTHVQYFTRGSIGTLLRAQRVRRARDATAPKAFSVEYYLARIEG